MEKYNHVDIEKKWQKRWEEQGLFKTPKEATRENKMYILPQLPYPSGSGLHVGHAEVYSACDIYARFQRMNGKQVLQAIGWDSFGLPAENYAIKTNVHPRESTNKAIDNFRKQIKELGISVDWDREVGSHNSDYYHWTQWFFLLMYKRGLAYRKKQAVNWCDSCKTVLANEQVTTAGDCERCATAVVQKDMEQWFLKITDYADRLHADLDNVDWPDETKKRQRDWIGRSEGAHIRFRVPCACCSDAPKTGKIGCSEDKHIEVFTTRPDTIFGATYMVLAPEHALVQEWKDRIENWEDVSRSIEETRKKTELDRQTQKEKTGVELKGVKAVNPASGEEMPVWIAEYVLATYGTGAIMAVPAHDERDWEFAKAFGLPARVVVHAKKAKYTIIEKSLEDSNIEKLKNFGVAEVLKETKGWGKFFIVAVDAKKEQELVDFLSENLLETSDDGGAWYADSVGTTNVGVFPHKYISLDTPEGIKAFREYGVSVGIVPEQLEIEPGAFIEEGISVNSDFLNGLETEEAKEKIIAWLEEKEVGKRHTQYKLRDWSVSRQRFWGAPIPMLFSEKEKNKKRQYILLHGYTGRPDKNFLPWLKHALEQEGHTVHAPLLPNTDKPDILEQVAFVRDSFTFDEDTVLVAHSLAGSVAMKLLEGLSVQIAKVVTIDSNIEKDRDYTAGSFDWSFDFEKIKTKAREFVYMVDTRHEFVKKEYAESVWKKLGARIVYAYPNDVHFCAEEEPSILEEVIVSGLLPVPEDDLPVLLPDDVDFKPTGESPLNYSKEFQKGVEKKYGKGWTREPDTLDTFMCSSWYYYRYLDPHNDSAFASPEALKMWMPVDFYLGGAEHVNGHLLYSRFFTKVLFDAGSIDFDEPFKKTRHQGIILGEDNRKMSKRWGNVVNPTDVVNEYGADTCRMYEMFMGPLPDTKPWDTNGVKGVWRFLEKVWKLAEKVQDNTGKENIRLQRILHQTIKKVTEDTAQMRFNTAIAKMMELANALQKEEVIAKKDFEKFVLLLAPYAPHLSEELWHEVLGYTSSVATEGWPAPDPALIREDVVKLAIQVNGKLRDTIEVAADTSEENAKAAALASEKIQKWLDNKKPKKIIYVKGKLINFVV